MRKDELERPCGRSFLTAKPAKITKIFSLRA